MDLPSDSLFFAGAMAFLLPALTSVFGLYFSLAGLGVMVMAVYSIIELPFHQIVVAVGGVVGLSLGIYSALQIGQLESGIPLFMIILLLVTSVVSVEEEARRYV